MRSTLLLGHAAVLCLALGFGAQAASAEPRHKQKKESDTTDRTLDKQMAWEQKVMGDDGAKTADLKKIAAAQKLADEGRNNPAPPPPPKVKDPNKEGVRAKQEASIGLPIASDEAQGSRATKKAAVKKETPSSSANDELGALVASSLAEDKASGSASPSDLFGSSSSGASSGGSKAKRQAVAAPAAKGNKGKKKAHAKARARGKKARA